ncbi:MAG: hypothetical protein LBR83_07405 [Clostridiales bacterium]|jgi:response regulator of citrate/malate metabolism|nr:hypothetical protein [Clostridiales bacterium]
MLRQIQKAIKRLSLGFYVIGTCGDPRKDIAEIVSVKPDIFIYEMETGGIRMMNTLRKNGIENAFIAVSPSQSGSLTRDFFTFGGFDYWRETFDGCAGGYVHEGLVKETLEKYERLRRNGEELVPARRNYSPPNRCKRFQ